MTVSASWSSTPVYGTWIDADGSPMVADYEIDLPNRVTVSVDNKIMPKDRKITGTLDATGSFNVPVPCNDDPDILPQGWQPTVKITFSDGTVETYQINTPESANTLTPPGVNLANEVSVQQIQTTQVLVANIPGGLATLDHDGDVTDAFGNKVVASGPAGQSAYDIAVANGYVGTETEWLASLQGANGAPGADGAAGQSAYQEAVANGFVGTETEWLASLQGPQGPAATSKQVVVSTGGELTRNSDIRLSGVPIPDNATLDYVQVLLEEPADADCPVSVVLMHANGTFSTVANLIVLAGTVGIENTAALGIACVSGDWVFIQPGAANFRTKGTGPTARLGFNGSTLTRPPAPTAVTDLTVIPGDAEGVLTWTRPALAINFSVYRDGVYLDHSSGATYRDLDVLSGETHTYAVYSRNPGNISAPSNSVTVTFPIFYRYFSSFNHQTDGDPVGFTVVKGTNTGTSAQVVSDTLQVRSGSVGSGNHQDWTITEWVEDVTPHSEWRVTCDMKLKSLNSVVDIYLSANDGPTSNTSFGSSPFSNGLQLELNSGKFRFGSKAAGYNAGGFTTLTDTSGVAASTATSADGYPALPSNGFANDIAKFYSWSLEMLPVNGDGTRTVKFYFGSTSQRKNDALPLVNTLTLPAAIVTAMAAGKFWINTLGKQGAVATDTEGFDMQYLSVSIPTSSSSGLGNGAL